MALSRVGGSSAAVTAGSETITIPAHINGDLLVMWAYRDGVTTPPTIPSAGGSVPTWNTIDAATGANLNSAACCWAVGTGSSTSGTWTNATGMSIEVWRGQAASPIGGHARGSGAATTNLTIPAITQVDTSGASVLLVFAGWRTVLSWTSPPATGYTQRSQVATECEAATKDSTTSDGSTFFGGTSSASGGYQTQQTEILVAASASTEQPELLLLGVGS